MAYILNDKTSITHTASNEEEIEIKALIYIAWLNIQDEIIKSNERCESIITQTLDGDPAPLKEGKIATQDHITTITLRCEPKAENKIITAVIEKRYLGIAHGSAKQGQTPDCEYIETYKGQWLINKVKDLTAEKIASILYGTFNCNYEYINYEEWLEEWHKHH